MDTSRLDQITKYSLLVFAFSIPWSSALYRMSVFALCLCFLAHLWLTYFHGHLATKGKTLNGLCPDLIWLWPVGLSIWVAASWFWTSGSPELYRFDAWRYIKLLMIPVIGFFIHRLFDSQEIKIIKAFCLGVVVLMIPTYLDFLGVFQLLQISDLVKGDAAYHRHSSMGLNLVYWRNQIVHGFHVAMLFGISLLTKPKNGSSRYLHWGIAALCMFDVLYLIVGKMALFSLIASAFLVLLLSVKNNKLKYLAFSAIFLAVFIALSSGIQQRIFLIWNEASSFYLNHRIDTSTGNRLHYWGISIELFLQHPIIGNGAGSFREFLMVSNDPLSQIFHYHTHNEYLTQLSQFGLIGLVLFLGIFYWAIKSARQNPDLRVQNCVLLTMVLFAMNAFSDSSLHNEWEGWTLVLFTSIAIANQMQFKPRD